MSRRQGHGHSKHARISLHRRLILGRALLVGGGGAGAGAVPRRSARRHRCARGWCGASPSCGASTSTAMRWPSWRRRRGSRVLHAAGARRGAARRRAEGVAARGGVDPGGAARRRGDADLPDRHALRSLLLAPSRRARARRRQGADACATRWSRRSRDARGHALEDAFQRDAVDLAQARRPADAAALLVEKVETELAGPAHVYVGGAGRRVRRGVGAAQAGAARKGTSAREPTRPRRSEAVKTRADLKSARRVVVKIGIAPARRGRRRARGGAGGRGQGAARSRRRASSSSPRARSRSAGGGSAMPRSRAPCPGLQAAAAVGQGHLIHAYQRALAAARARRRRRCCSRTTTCAIAAATSTRASRSASCCARGAVPVVNENDTVSVDEIKFGDNDRLAALCTSLVEADALVILTDVDGLYDGDPRRRRARSSPRCATSIARRSAVAGGSSGDVGTGGMASKVQAAKIAARFGVVTVVASGRRERAGDVDPRRRPTPAPCSGRRRRSTACRRASTGLPTRSSRPARSWSTPARAALSSTARSRSCRRASSVPRAASAPAIRCASSTKRAPSSRAACVAFDAEEIEKIAGRRSADLAALLGYAPPTRSSTATISYYYER